MDKVKYLVPATTSNLGPGFDVLGLALSWNITIEASRQKKPSANLIRARVPRALAGPMNRMVREVVTTFEARAGIKCGPVSFHAEGDIPIARGLGSSATYRLGTATCLNVLHGRPLTDHDILTLVCGLEHHTDNAVAAQAGGLTVSGYDAGELRYTRLKVPDRFRFVALVPEKQVATDKSRKVLPPQLALPDAIANLHRSIRLAVALSGGKPGDLAGVFEDRIHQPYRKKLLPFLPSVIKAAMEAGALGAFLSGSGSTVIAVAEEKPSAVIAAAMKKALSEKGEKGITRILRADNQGIRPAS